MSDQAGLAGYTRRSRNTVLFLRSAQPADGEIGSPRFRHQLNSICDLLWQLSDSVISFIGSERNVGLSSASRQPTFILGRERNGSHCGGKRRQERWVPRSNYKRTPGLPLYSFAYDLKRDSLYNSRALSFSLLLFALALARLYVQYAAKARYLASFLELERTNWDLSSITSSWT